MGGGGGGGGGVRRGWGGGGVGWGGGPSGAIRGGGGGGGFQVGRFGVLGGGGGAQAPLTSGADTGVALVKGGGGASFNPHPCHPFGCPRCCPQHTPHVTVSTKSMVVQDTSASKIRFAPAVVPSMPHCPEPGTLHHNCPQPSTALHKLPHPHTTSHNHRQPSKAVHEYPKEHFKSQCRLKISAALKNHSVYGLIGFFLRLRHVVRRNAHRQLIADRIICQQRPNGHIAIGEGLWPHGRTTQSSVVE